MQRSVSTWAEQTRILAGADIGKTADVLFQMTDQIDSISHSETIQLISTCGQKKVYDSELFLLLESRLDFEGADECLYVVRAVNDLSIITFNDSVFNWVQNNTVWDLSKWFEICDLFLRVGDEKKLHVISEKFSNTVTEHIKLCLLEGVKTHIHVDEAMNIILYLAKLGTCRADDVNFLTLKIISYELRNVHDLNLLIRLFFSLSKLETFDDYFIRRKLVPSIFHVYKKSEKTFKEIPGILSMLEQLPFTNDLVREFKELLTADFNAMDPLTECKYYCYCSGILGPV